jgi:hypothetical protein
MALRDWFGRNRNRRVQTEPTVSPPMRTDEPSLDFGQMSVDELLSWVSTLPTTCVFQSIKDGLRRLYDIAYFEHGVAERDRAIAAQLVVTFLKTFEDAYANAPAELAALKRATEFTERGIATHGVNSLAWLMEDYGIPGTETIPFIMNPEYGNRLASFMETTDTRALQNAKPHMVRQLILQRHVRAYPNTVIHLHGLVCSGDPAALAIFTRDEIKTITLTPFYYQPAREILVELELLAVQSNAPNLVLPPEDNLLKFIVSQAAMDTVAQGPPQALERIAPPADMQGLDLIVPIALCLHLGLTMIESIYGAEKRFVALDGIEQQFSGASASGLLKLVGMMKNFEKFAVDRVVEEAQRGVATFSIDQMMAFASWHEFNLWPNEEQEWEAIQPYLKYLMKILSHIRIDYLIRLRSYLRFFIHCNASQGVPQTEAVAEIRSTVNAVYVRYGSQPGIVGAAPHSEDWIGQSS